MTQRTDSFELDGLKLASGEARHLELDTAIGDLQYGGERYVVAGIQHMALDVERTMGHGYVLTLRFSTHVSGSCMRCLEPAEAVVQVEVKEVQQQGGGEELTSPYVDEDNELNVSQWAHDALALSLPSQIVCRSDCAGLCAECGINLNQNPGHAHTQESDPRWAKLSEIKFE
jgi:uncharacterized protein